MGKCKKKSRASSLVVDLAQLFEGATEKSKMFCKMQRWKKKFRSFPTQADLSVRAEKSPFFYASDEFRMNFYVADSFFSDILYRNEKCICIDILPSSSTDHHVLLSFYYGRDEHSMWMVRALEDIITSAAANTYTTHVPTSENKILQMETSDFFFFLSERREICYWHQHICFMRPFNNS